MNNSNLCFYIFTGKSIYYQYQYFVRFWVKPPDQIALHGYEDTGCSSAIIFTLSEQSHHMCLQGTNHMQIWKVNMWQTSQCSIHSPSPLPLQQVPLPTFQLSSLAFLSLRDLPSRFYHVAGQRCLLRKAFSHDEQNLVCKYHSSFPLRHVHTAFQDSLDGLSSNDPQRKMNWWYIH